MMKSRLGEGFFVTPEGGRWVLVGSNPNVEKAPYLEYSTEKLLCWTNIYISKAGEC